MFGIYHPNDEGSWFILDLCRNLDSICILPEALGLDKVDPMLVAVCPALVLVKLEFHYGIDIIPNELTVKREEAIDL